MENIKFEKVEGLIELTENELLVTNGGGIFSDIGHAVGTGLAYVARGLSMTNTATQVNGIWNK
jgi:hypothetical protein